MAARRPRGHRVPQLLVGVSASAQQTSAGDAQTPWLHQEVSALWRATPHVQQVGRQCVGSLQALPGAPLLPPRSILDRTCPVRT